jgi:hypothetical protein
MASNQKLEFDAECAALGSSSLDFRPKAPRYIDLTFKSPFPQPSGYTIKMGVYYFGIFQCGLFPVTLTPTVLADKGVYRIDMNELDPVTRKTIIQRIDECLENAQPEITKSSFKDGKATASVFLFLSSANCCDQRIAGAIPIEITLACDCCTTTAKPTAASTGVLPAPVVSPAGTPAPATAPTPAASPAAAPSPAASEGIPAGAVAPESATAPALSAPATAAPGCSCSAELANELIVR